MIPILKTIPELKAALKNIHPQSVGFVPTMGALHEGHLSLIRTAKAENAFVVLSIFVNPLQFGANEDLDKYPRRLAQDVDLAAASGADFVFAPDYNSFYTAEHQSFVYNPQIENLYCGFYRPGHFRGVLTVVAKLFLAVLPQKAYFGKKDYQQAYLIEKMVLDLNFPLEVVKLPTIREEDGLAMSSRNEYLSAQERQNSTIIWKLLNFAKNQLALENWGAIQDEFKSELIKAGATSVDYVELVSQSTLLSKNSEYKWDQSEELAVLVAARFGNTRLIDNLEI